MQMLEPIDEDTPIEGYPDFLGHTWDDGFASLNDVLKPLDTINWSDYVGSIDEDAIWLDVDGVGRVEIATTSSLGEMLDQIPSLDVRRDPECGEEIFFLRDGYAMESVAAHIAALVAAVRKDFVERATQT